MPARRVCACGARLEESGDVLLCSGRGAQARTWRVPLNGRTMAAGTLPGHQAEAQVAYAGTSEDGLLGLLEPTQPIRYAVPSSWRHQHRRHQTERG